ncbi:17981_t:CDS:2, partial [Gigaspora margarita]
PVVFFMSNDLSLKLRETNYAYLVQNIDVYELSNAMQRSSLLEEFYDPEFTLFKTEILNIKDLIAENPSNKDKILKNLFQAIQYIINKLESFNYIIMHRILLEYFTYADEP